MNRAVDVANALLRLGVLDPTDADQRALREELLQDTALWDEVSRRVEAVGYTLVQFLGHLGVRLARRTAVDPLVNARNNLGLHAQHVRVLVYLWIQLLYREMKETLREEQAQPSGRSQMLLGVDSSDGDEPPSLLLSELEAEFAEDYTRSALKGALTTLRRLSFVKEEKKRLLAGPAMYVQIDHARMEEHVVGLARAGALELPEGEE